MGHAGYRHRFRRGWARGGSRGRGRGRGCGGAMGGQHDGRVAHSGQARDGALGGPARRFKGCPPLPGSTASVTCTSPSRTSTPSTAARAQRFGRRVLGLEGTRAGGAPRELSYRQAWVMLSGSAGCTGRVREASDADPSRWADFARPIVPCLLVVLVVMRPHGHNPFSCPQCPPDEPARTHALPSACLCFGADGVHGHSRGA